MKVHYKKVGCKYTSPYSGTIIKIIKYDKDSIPIAELIKIGGHLIKIDERKYEELLNAKNHITNDWKYSNFKLLTE